MMMSNSDEDVTRRANHTTHTRLSSFYNKNEYTETNTTHLADRETIQMRAMVPSPAFNRSVVSVVPEAQVVALKNVSVSSRRGKPRFSRSIVITSAIMLVVLVGGLFLLMKLLKSTPGVVAYRTHVQNVTLSVGGSGIVYASQELHISFPDDEQVTNVYIKPGDQVTQGQSLVQLDLSQLNAQIKQASDDVAAAQSYLNSVAGTAQASAAQLSYDQAVSRYNALQAQAASPTLHNGTLVAPFTGTVAEVTVQPGELAKANTSLVTLLSESTVVAHVEVSLVSLPHVFANQDALITPSAIPNLTLHGTVSSVIQQSSATTDTFEVWVAIDNSSKQLLPGMTVFARLQDPLYTLVVPRAAVVNPDQGATVFVINHGHVTLRHVQTGGYVGDLMVIEAGLSDGDEIALTGVDTLTDGEAVNVSHVQS